MNIFDIIAAIILIYCPVRGIFRGLVREISSIIGTIYGFYCAYTYYPDLAQLLSGWIYGASYINVLSFLFIFCVVFVIISILGVIVKYILNIASLGWIDRFCGAGLGIFKGGLIVSVILIAFTAFLPKNASVVKDSLIAPHITFLSEKMARLIPNNTKNTFTDKIDNLKNSWNEL
jgi:membrane protein required for colicin V production